MDRVKKLKLNTTVSLLSKAIVLLSGLIIPRLILVYYGSEVNGLVTSIRQFLRIITFLDLGVGSVVQAALYRPLAKNDKIQTSVVLKAARNYFKKISLFLIIYIIVLTFLYPLIIDNQSLSYLSTVMLIIAISISLFAQYYFGIVNELLLNADQKGYIQLGTEIVVVILSLVVSSFLITQGISIEVVQLTIGLIYLIRPIYLNFYVKKHYNLINDVEINKDPLPQKWSGMGQHVANSINNNIDILALTFFSTLESVSIYSVYGQVVSAVRIIIASSTVGITSFFGDLIANRETDILNNYFSKVEWGIHTVVSYLYGITIVLINPFVMLYTSGVTDVDYYVPIFSVLIVLARATYSLRTPYQVIIFSAGHFKETQLSSIIEMGINIIITLLLVNYLGLLGVVLGTIVAMTYRTLYLVLYLSHNILYRPITKFVKHIIIDSITIVCMILAGSFISNFLQITTIFEWVYVALGISVLFIIIIFVINLVFYKDMVNYTLKKLIKKINI